MRTVPPIPDDLPDSVRCIILGYDAELDAIHPGWRQCEPFGSLPYAELARVKWCLKRRELLLYRTALPDGTSRPTPRDWIVRIVPNPADPRMCFAVPTDPAHSVAVAREITTEPPRVTP